jgi:S1-C subfamily serine protease
MSRRTRVFLVALLGVVVIIVAHDLWRTSRPTPAQPLPVVTPAAPEVRRGLDKSPLLYPSEFAAELSQRAARSLVTVEAADAPGIVIRGLAVSATDVVISPVVAARGWRVRDGAETTRPAQLVAADAVHGIAVLRVSGVPLASMPFPRGEPDWRQPVVALAAGRVDGRSPAAQPLGAQGSFDVLAAWLRRQPASPGDLVVNLEGELVAYAGAAVSGVTPLSASLLQQIAEALRSSGVHRHPWIGVHLQVIDAPLRPRFPEGALVAVHVEPDSPAIGRIVPGMVFTEVSVGQEKATTPERVRALLHEGTSVSFAALSGTAIELRVGDRQVPLGFAVGEDGVQIAFSEVGLSVAPQSVAAARGLRTGDVLRAIDLRPLGTPAQIRAALRGSRDRLLTVQRGDQWRFVHWPGSGGTR